ncbi:MAG: hypothetical protein LW698_14825 [Planctomycetaceae bacterium]|jgi:hypothetical protein|nr:hypothetical protein [Planctomycetaceae bacterium]
MHTRRVSLFLIAVLASGLSPGLPRSLADALPKDTNKIESLTPEQAQKLAQEFRGADVPVEFKGVGTLWCFQCLPLNGLKSIDAELAKALAGYARGPLLLNGLTTLSGDAAKALAQREGELSLNGLTTLSDEAAKALAQHKGTLYLNGLTTLSPQAARALSAGEKWNGQLPSLTAFVSPDSVAVAEALATTKGPLKLPSLKKISPKTLTALIKKKDVEIPLIESLELISEPDGSATEDFVIPEWLEERQKQQRAARAAQ